MDNFEHTPKYPVQTLGKALDILNYIKNVVDIVVQLKRGSGGRRFISEIYYRDFDRSI